MKYYTGVGTRKIPKHSEEYALLEMVGMYLATKGWTLRSGAADGADTAFEAGCDVANGEKEIYIPWNGFNNRFSDWQVHAGVTPDASLVASSYHPAWDKCSHGAKMLHSRNIYQVLGKDILTPSDILVCYAPVDTHGVPKGGTRTAWVVAKSHNIPCFNLVIENDLQALRQHLKGK